MLRGCLFKGSGMRVFTVCGSQEAESKPQCRRLQLKDIIPTEMQRLTKYPLLLENIAKSTGTASCQPISSF